MDPLAALHPARQHALGLYILGFSIVAILLSTALYLPGLSGDYVFDDIPNLLNNDRLHIETLDAESLAEASLSSGSGLLKRPVSMFSFALNYYFFGEGPASFKIINLAIHIINGIGLFTLTFLLISLAPARRRIVGNDKSIFLISLTICLAWLAHPINLTTVLYIVQRMAGLSALFTIYGLVFYTWYRNRIFHGNGSVILLVSGTLPFFLLATLSKENGALLPLYIVLIEAALFRFRRADGQADAAIRRAFLIGMLIPLIVAVAWFSTSNSSFMAGYAVRDFTLGERLMTEARVLCYYLRLIALPTLPELGLYHDDIAVSRSLLDPPSTLAAIAFLGFMLATGLALIRRAPLVGLGILWFFVSHLMESTLLPLEIAHEHRNYLASYGVLLAAAWSGLLLLNKAGQPGYARLAAFLIIASVSIVTLARSAAWESNISLALSEAEHHPSSPRATYAVGRVYANLALSGELHLTDTAIELLERAQEVGVQNINPEVALVILASKTGRGIDKRWLSTLADKLSRQPISASTVSGLKDLLRCNRDVCRLDKEFLVGLFRKGLENRLLARSTQTKADFYTVYADFAINDLHDVALGEHLFKAAIAAYPIEPQYRINYIRLLIASGRMQEARDQLEELRNRGFSTELMTGTDSPLAAIQAQEIVK